ncbi:hypothetical protein H9L39_17388 [Fusarium oxysporum f. sp. albedinis]|nr:hypothetical protein H9L39_17388 [Fusarium oxysporum f. sp. albedinis]
MVFPVSPSLSEGAPIFNPRLEAAFTYLFVSVPLPLACPSYLNFPTAVIEILAPDLSRSRVVTAAAIAVASPARPAQAHVYANRRTGSVSKLNQRSSSGILALVVAGPDRTQSVIATILDLAIPPPQRHSNGTLSRLPPPRLDVRLRGLQPGQEPAGPGVPRASPCLSNINLASAVATQAALTNNSPSQPYIATDPNQPPPIKSPVTANKMH